MRFYKTGSGAMAVTVEPTNGFKLEEIRVHLDTAATQETLVVTVDSIQGAAYDTVLFDRAMTGTKDQVCICEPGEGFCQEGDKILIAFTNTDARTWGVTAKTTPRALEPSIAV